MEVVTGLGYRDARITLESIDVHADLNGIPYRLALATRRPPVLPATDRGASVPIELEADGVRARGAARGLGPRRVRAGARVLQANAVSIELELSGAVRGRWAEVLQFSRAGTLVGDEADFDIRLGSASVVSSYRLTALRPGPVANG